MLRLLKAEFAYNRFGFIMGYCFIISFFFVIQKWGKPEFTARDTLLTMWIATIIHLKYREILLMKDNRERYLAGLPLRTDRLGLVNLIYSVLFWFSMPVVLFTLIFIFRSGGFENGVLKSLLPFNGIVFITIAAFHIYRNLHKHLLFSKKKLLLSFVWLVIVLAGYFLIFYSVNFLGAFRHITVPGREALSNFYNSTPGTITFNLFGMVLLYINVLIFVRRKSYIESI